MPEEVAWDFAVDTGDWVYIDDAFRGTNQPNYARGFHQSSEGLAGDGALELWVGGVDDNAVSDMSGGGSTHSRCLRMLS